LVTVGAILIIETAILAAEAFLAAPVPQFPGFLIQALLAQSATRSPPT
jgi:hypothetical protein